MNTGLTFGEFIAIFAAVFLGGFALGYGTRLLIDTCRHLRNVRPSEPDPHELHWGV